MTRIFHPLSDGEYGDHGIGWGEGNRFGHIQIYRWVGGPRPEMTDTELRDAILEMLNDKARTDPEFARRVGVATEGTR